MISVIVPVYNVSQYLPQCIKSILSQSYRNFELLLVDDGSSDNSLSICENYAKQDNRISVLSKKNGGVSSARNLGLDNIHGEWVAFIDGDDYVNEFYLEHMMRALKVQDMADLVIAGFTRVDDTSLHSIIDKWTYDNDLITTQQITFDQLNKIITWGVSVSKLFRASIIKAQHIRFNNIPIKEDVAFLLNFVDKCNLIALTEYNDYLYVKRQGSALNNNRSFEQKVTQHKLFCAAIEQAAYTKHQINVFARHCSVWSVISEVYSFGNKSPKRRQLLRNLNPSALNAKCLTKYSMTTIDAFGIWLLKHKHLLVFDTIKRTQVHLLNLISALYKLIK